MIEGFEYGYAKGEHAVWCIHREGVSTVMLCGRAIGFVPVVQPEQPSVVHQACLEAMYGTSKRTPVGYGVCPVCDGDAPVVDGRIQVHGAWRVGSDGPYQSQDPCLGVNMPAKRSRR